MCTAVTYKTKDHYFGRNLDYEFSYHETVTVTPRNYPFHFRKMGDISTHYAMIGMAYVVDDYPLYYDATNEKGLSIAGLNFPGNADYKPFVEGKENVSPFELIPWILSQCATVEEAKILLGRMNLWNENFSEELLLSPLHWIISDRDGSITLESVKDGLKIYENPMGILTNNPPFDYQMFNLNNYMHLTKETPVNTFAGGYEFAENDSVLSDSVSCDSIVGNSVSGGKSRLELQAYSRGMGGLGLPGDLSSMSRFVKAAFTKMNAVSGDSEMESVSQFFHIIKSVEQQRGCVHMGNNMYEITIYSSCCNTDKGIYYYTTYENSQICAVDMHRENLDGEHLVLYMVLDEQKIFYQN